MADITPNDNFSENALEDWELVKSAVNNNDQKAYGVLLEKYQHGINATVRKMVFSNQEADDLTIETFGKAFNKLHTYQPTYAFSTWLYKIASNNCIDFLRKKRMQTVSLDKEIAEDYSIKDKIQAKGLDPEEKYIKEQKIEAMREFVEQLKPRYRSLIELRYFKELSYDEIAAELELPLGTVKAQLFRAKELLFNIVKDHREKL